ncbi:uncharacterized protein BDW47DRAFT_100510 [Aspergillus candidus]|uniref:Uncharacterized protein n=1 Tax=Aspergillus candidus TaxID=41067 RepID=A0A2I2FKE2_ASPCN|nr:hypothetical protein BDW47DRAFT_100510 [Aspergillus candidus]PLB41108.1 hypothetical protein BDW47DRAFT_100510 [Aspergillus candidus]
MDENKYHKFNVHEEVQLPSTQVSNSQIISHRRLIDVELSCLMVVLVFRLLVLAWMSATKPFYIVHS